MSSTLAPAYPAAVWWVLIRVIIIRVMFTSVRMKMSNGSGKAWQEEKVHPAFCQVFHVSLSQVWNVLFMHEEAKWKMSEVQFAPYYAGYIRELNRKERKCARERNTTFP